MLRLWNEKYPLTARLIVWIVLPIVAGCLYLYLFLIGSLPETDGALSLQAPSGLVSIKRDPWGVPHIAAESDRDAFYALGVMHAQDRLWQMEYQRRLGQGRLAEILGPEALASDKLMRTLGLKAVSEQAVVHLSAQALDSLNAYAEGINDWVKAMPVLPIEFYYYGLRPDPWVAADSLLLIKLMAFNLGANYQNELSNHVLTRHLGRTLAGQLLGLDESQFTDISAVESDANNLETLFAQQLDVESSTGLDKESRYGFSGEGIGSNAWVVAGKYAQNGLPVLSGDPHLRLQLPSAFYLASMEGNKLHVTGATLPGVPAVIFGHNQSIAWSGTNLAADVQDLYVERNHLDDDELFEYQGQWERAEVRQETIHIAQAFPAFLRTPYKPVVWRVRATRNGPLISDAFSQVKAQIALKWSALDPVDNSFQGFLDINYAQNREQFQNALGRYHAPALSFAYADKGGNIALFTAGKIPLRKKGGGNLPVPGWTDEYQWQGYLSPEQMPKVINPQSGVIVSANNRIHAEGYPYLISNNWQPDYRARRISELLQQMLERKEKLSVADMMKIQSDVVDLQAGELVPYLSSLNGEDDTQREIIQLLGRWDSRMAAESSGATIFRVWSKYLYERIIQDELKVELVAPERLGVLKSQLNQYKPKFLQRVISGQYAHWCDDIETTIKETCDDVALLSLRDTVKELKQFLGGAPDDWQWHSIHKALFPHTTFSRHPFLSKVFNREHPVDGGRYTINVAAGDFSKDEGYLQKLGASFRQIVDLGDLEHAAFIIDSGQSGNIFSRHYDDLVDMHANNHYVEINAKHSPAAAAKHAFINKED